MANNSYPAEQPGLAGGLPGNNLSRELEIIPAAKLARIPETMSDVEASAFSIGAQTTFSMVRKLGISAGSAVLVTGGRSNTSLFAINAIKAQRLNPAPEIWASTTSERSEQALLEMGISGVIRIDPAAPRILLRLMAQIANESMFALEEGVGSPSDIDKAAGAGAPTPSGLAADEIRAYERLKFVYGKGVGYAYQMGLRPQSLYGIADSPVGLAGYLLDHDAWSLDLIARAGFAAPHW